jgi:DNA mismatch repair ATPase MutL
MAIMTKIAELFKKFSTIGTPSDDDVLYHKIVKRKVPAKSAEALVMDDIKRAVGHAKNKIMDIASPEKENETMTETTNLKSETTSTKSPTEKKILKKVATKKTTKTTAKAKVTKKPVKSSTTSIQKSKKSTPSSSTPKGSKKAAKIALYTKDIKKHYGEVDEDFLAIIVKNLGPSIYRKDAELVSCSDPKELDTVRQNFLIKKLGLDASKAVLDAAIQDVCSELKGVRNKYRATFYYTLAKKFKKESALS